MGKLRYKIDSVQFKVDKLGRQTVTKLLKETEVKNLCKECKVEPKLVGSSRGANCKKIHTARQVANKKLENYRNENR